jgi:fatty acid desaturase
LSTRLKNITSMVEISTPSTPRIIKLRRGRVEWPTIVLAVAIYGGWAALTYWFDAVAWWLALPLAAWLTAWHMSLQHEVLHGHPTKSRRVNGALGFAPLSLWLPYERYRQLHLSHHRDHLLTDPLDDPESYYLSPENWYQRPWLVRMLTRFRNTSAGRLLLNPAFAIPHFLIGDARALLAGSRRHWRIWTVHLLGVAAILTWVIGVCHIPLWQYLVFFVYPGFALASLRSFAEHRAAAMPGHRTAIVENATVFGLLFLYNNLHVVHHDHPFMPWYAIPAYYRAHRAKLIQQNAGLVYNGYRDVIGRYLFRIHHSPMLEREQPRAVGRAA